MVNKVNNKKIITKKQLEEKTFLNQEMKNQAIASFSRYNFYKDGYLKSLTILIFSILTLVFSIYTLYYTIVQYKPPVKYFPVDNNYQLIRSIPLDQDIMKEELLMQYVSDITKDIFEYNYRNAEKHGLKIKPYFMDKGYSDFMEYFENSDELKIVQKNGYIVESEIAEPPELIRKGLISKRFKFWEYQLTMKRLFVAPGAAIFKRYRVKILIMRRPKEEFESGLGIYNIITEEIK